MKKVLITGGYGMVGSAMESQIKLSRETCDFKQPLGSVIPYFEKNDSMLQHAIACYSML